MHRVHQGSHALARAPSELIVHLPSSDLGSLGVDLDSPLGVEKDVSGSVGACGAAATTVHWLPVGNAQQFCRQACASAGVDSSFLTVGTCDEAGFHNYLGTHSRSGAPGFEGATTVSDFTSRRSIF
ncbi:hypothetical protein KFE25_007706 [Diacronema lutheri]|uniref:Uncharacterized protein n=1 Tax=Diacronema lutheri TaxID=2081491 RepID=A0A6T6BF88_DIALT|nr:hypothetical protein KFE25_007706 [Diacronema lutheri]